MSFATDFGIKSNREETPGRIGFSAVSKMTVERMSMSVVCRNV